jgi:hypothetical protein
MRLSEPVLKQALGDDWGSLAPSIQAHYGLAPFTDQRIHVKGSMDSVSHSPLATLLIPFTSLAGALIPYTGKNVPVEVINYSLPREAAYFWLRTFSFPGRKPFVFRSAMICTGPREVTEFVRFGLGLRSALSVVSGSLVEVGHGYVWRIGARTIPLPLNKMMGKSYVEETPISETEFVMRMSITHPLFGETFAYSGRFAVAR